MNIARIIRYISNHQALLSILFTALNGVAFILNNYRLQEQKSELDKEVETYKRQLQVEFLKAEAKTKHLFNIYPEMFAKFKYVEGELIIRQSNMNSEHTEKARKILDEAYSCMTTNLLFISEETKRYSMEAYHLMKKSLNESKQQNITNLSILKNLLNKLEKQMKKELGYEVPLDNIEARIIR